MEYLHIEYFVKVAETGNMTRAAELLNVSQPSLSQTISRLEDELGVELFDRKGKRIVLNDAGKRFLVYANQSLNAINEARKAVSAKNQQQLKGNITIGLAIPFSLIVDCVASYSKENPYVNFTINSIFGIEDSPLAKDSDFIFGYGGIEHPGYVNNFLLGHFQRYVAVPSHMGGEVRKIPSMNELMLGDFISLTPNKDKLEKTYEQLAERGRFPNIKFRTNSTEIKRIVLERGLAAGFINETTVKNLKQTGEFHLIPINYIDLGSLSSEKTDPIAVTWKEDRILSPAAQSFLNYLHEWFK